MKTASEKGNEYAFATKLGLFFGNIDKKTGHFTENTAESYFENKSVESFFEFGNGQIVAQVRGGDQYQLEEIVTIDRKTKQTLVRISNDQVGMYSKKMQKMSQFCMDTFPYVLMREFESLYMLDIKNNR